MVVFIALHFCNLTSSQSFSKIDSIINKEVDEHRVAGGTALIIHEGRVKYNKALGYSDIAANKKMETHSIFRIASQTKAIVSVGLLQMLEKYEIGLDEPIERFIPAFSNQKVAIIKRDSIQLVERKRPITIRDVLTHQSGISSAATETSFGNLTCGFCAAGSRIDTSCRRWWWDGRNYYRPR
jgi:CubicO group peptidase (beta-lactamase class C family)